ncbi:MAG: PxKF domain-containing protein [Candidatus Jorgensenbacteria bacterium]
MKKFVLIFFVVVAVLAGFRLASAAAFVEQPDDSVQTPNSGSSMNQTLNRNQLGSPTGPKSVSLTGTWSFTKIHFGDTGGVPLDGNNKLRFEALERATCDGPTNQLAFIEIPYTGDGFYTFNFPAVTLDPERCYDFVVTFLRHGTTNFNGKPYGTNDPSKYPFGSGTILGGIGGVEDWYFITDIPYPGATLDPVVIIPGFLGSEEKDGELILQPRLKPYDGLKLTLLANGYTENETLFDFPYDWRKSNVVTASLLENKIQEIKTICQCNKVDVIAHSMGGLVARQYIQSGSYQNDIDQLIFLGTPHIGAPKAYFAWEGGTSGVRFSINDLLLDAIFRQEAIEAGFGSFTNLNQILFNYIRSTSSPILSLQELLPTYDYLKDFNTGVLRAYPSGYPQNTFLETLNSSSSISVLEESGVSITNIFSDDQDTISVIRVENELSTLPIWEHGVPRVIEDGVGDETVPLVSSLALGVINSTNVGIVGEHNSLPTNGVDEIYQILTGQPPTQIITVSEVKKFLSIFGLSPVDILVTAPDGKRIGKDFVTGQEFNEIDGAFYTGFNTPNENIFIPEPLDGEYIITTQGTGSGSYEILTDYVREEISGEATSTVVSFTANTSNNLIENLKFVFSSSAPEETVIVPEDITPPTITHTVIPSEVLLNAPSMIFNFSAQDDLTGVFSLSTTLDSQTMEDGAVINFTVPGRHTIEIRAEDFVGNISTETVNFDVVYNFGGLLPPVRTDGRGVYKGSRTLPVRFQLTDINNQFISTAVAKLFIAKVEDGVVGIEEAPVSTSSADTANFFRYDQEENQYIYNLSTKTMPAGTWQLKVALDDGKPHTVLISIK